MLEGRHIENYTLVRPIGSGGMADVYLVRHAVLGTQHALKVLHVGGASVAERLLAEGIVQARFRHVGLVRVTDAVIVDDHTGIVMDYVDGETLERHLQCQTFNLATRLEIFDAVLDAVEHAHRQGVVHRDLKPANILISMEGGLPIPRIVDFGLVKVVSETINVPHRRWVTGCPMGTPEYMAPEQIRSDPHIDRRTDLFALGCILHELVGERRPFEHHSIAETFAAITAGDYAPLGDYACGRNVQGAVAACLAVRREDRPADVAALRVLLGAPRGRATYPTLVPATNVEVPLGPASQRRWGYGTFGAALVGLVVVIGGVAFRWPPALAEEIGVPPVAVAIAVEPPPMVLLTVPKARRDVPTAPSSAVGGSFHAKGADVRLRDKRGNEWRPGDDMAPGSYKMRADFGEGFVPVGRARIVSGQRLQLTCLSASRRCDTSGT